ncbi:hypothetical protein HYH03_017156 [Edaphochlamys debaryana]|uniref:Uncharacterized protein n=1 Tax=Edaphochlamys debaryana TaxID=47281 RepID=A0A835XIE1_9CHLO|nr:hypothetical protein HYH03_017156 [Edaphochlamys debaryana]|eukprot:KAG2483989.1 hypothetical protein HYH03_017156 [Edaphochlamys debaryana]
MAATRALGRAFVAAGGTLLFLGTATAVVGGVTMGIAKAFVDKTQVQQQGPCTVCRGKQRVACEVCEGERILRYWPTPAPPPVQQHSYSVCAMCEGAGDHPCINCLGTGSVYPYPWGQQDGTSEGPGGGGGGKVVLAAQPSLADLATARSYGKMDP